MASRFLRDTKNKLWKRVDSHKVKTADIKYLHEKPQFFKAGTTLYREVWGYREFEYLEKLTVKRNTPKGMYILTNEYGRERKVYANEIGEGKSYTFTVRERVLKKIEKRKEIDKVREEISALEKKLTTLRRELYEI